MIALSVKKSGRLVTNPRAVEHDIRSAMDRGIFAGWKLVRRSLLEKMTQRGEGRDPFFGRKTTVAGLLVRTGLTRSRLTPAFRPVRIAGTTSAAVGSPDAHVADLEAGGPKSAGSGYFRIPLARAQTPAGVDRMAGRSIRGVPGFFLRRSKAGHLLGMRATPGGRRAFPWYLFVKSIVLRPRRMFARTVAETTPGVVAAVGREVTVAVTRANA